MNLKEKFSLHSSEGVGKFTEDFHTNACVDIAKKFAVSFSLFCAENYTHTSDSNVWKKNTYSKTYTTEELLNIYLEQYENTTQ